MLATMILGSGLVCPVTARAECLGGAGLPMDFAVTTADSRLDAQASAHCDGSSKDGAAASRHPATQPEVVFLPACLGNSPDGGASKDASCPQALAMCASTPVPDDLMFWRFERVVGPPPGPWKRSGGSCLRLSQVPGAGVPALTLTDFRRLPLPAGVMHVQPGTLRTLVNVETNVFVTGGPVVLTTSLLGQTVQVRATPVGYRWVFGDGGILETTDSGGAYPRMTTTHVYRRPGQVSVTLATRYAGEYSVAGGPWLPVDGQAEVTSAPVSVTVVATRNELVS